MFAIRAFAAEKPRRLTPERARPFVSFAFLLMCSSAGVAQAPRWDGEYSCAGIASGGISYNSSQQQWEGAGFRPTDEFTLRLIFKRTRRELHEGAGRLMVSNYVATITEAGQSRSKPCISPFQRDKSQTVPIYTERLQCVASLTQYTFNLRTGRYISAYLEGYVDGEDTNDDTPSVVVGTCKRIE